MLREIKSAMDHFSQRRRLSLLSLAGEGVRAPQAVGIASPPSCLVWPAQLCKRASHTRAGSWLRQSLNQTGNPSRGRLASLRPEQEEVKCCASERARTCAPGCVTFEPPFQCRPSLARSLSHPHPHQFRLSRLNPPYLRTLSSLSNLPRSIRPRCLLPVSASSPSPRLSCASEPFSQPGKPTPSEASSASLLLPSSCRTHTHAPILTLRI
jgi:hypothetical protein